MKKKINKKNEEKFKLQGIICKSDKKSLRKLTRV